MATPSPRMTKIIIPVCMMCFYLLVVTNGAEDIKTKGKLLMDCSLETKFSLEKYKPMEDADFAEPLLSPEFKCFVNCVFERFGLTKNGVVPDEDTAVTHLSSNPDHWKIVHSTMKDCGKNIENNSEKACEHSYQLFKCLMKTANMKHYLN